MADEFDQYKVKPGAPAKAAPTQDDEFAQYRVSSPPSESNPSLMGTGEDAMKNVGIGVGKGLMHTGMALSPAISKIAPSIVRPQDVNRAQGIATPEGTAQKIGFGGEQAAEFLAPGTLEEKAGLKAAELFPKVAKYAAALARMATQAVDTGVINKLQGGSAKEGAEAGLIGGGIGEAGRAIAPAIAESALGITRRQRGFGRTPGVAALEETKGVRPATVAQSAGKKAGELTDQLEQGAKASKVPVSVQPAIDVTDKAIQKAGTRNSPLGAQYKGVRGQLTHDLTTGQPLPITTSAEDILQRKRGIGDLKKTWTPEQHKGGGDIIPQVYHAMDSELDRAVPGAEQLNQRISSLIPVRDRGIAEDLNAGLAQRALHRIAAHTGAATLGAIGGYGGYERGGPMGAVGGAVAGIAAPELVTSPAFEMALARALRARIPSRIGTGVALQIARPSDVQR